MAEHKSVVLFGAYASKERVTEKIIHILKEMAPASVFLVTESRDLFQTYIDAGIPVVNSWKQWYSHARRTGDFITQEFCGDHVYVFDQCAFNVIGRQVVRDMINLHTATVIMQLHRPTSLLREDREAITEVWSLDNPETWTLNDHYWAGDHYRCCLHSPYSWEPFHKMKKMYESEL